jgi:hypothetical protein
MVGSPGRGSVGLPLRNVGWYVVSDDWFEDESPAEFVGFGAPDAAGAGWDAPGGLEAGAPVDGAEAGGGTGAGAVCGGFVEGVFVVESAGAATGGAFFDPSVPGEPAGGVLGASAGGGAPRRVGFESLPPARLRRGGPSLLSRPTGTFSAFTVFLASSLPAGNQVPCPSQRFAAIVLLFRNAALTVNKPSEVPLCKASYTVPVSSTMGTGEALYELAS